MEINVVNLKTHKRTPFDYYIGRGNGSVLGNPFTSIQGRTTLADKVVSSLEESINSHKKYLFEKIQQKDPAIIGELNKIKAMVQTQGKVNLVCFCSPKPCHGNTIKDLILQTIKLEVAQVVEARKAEGVWFEPGVENSSSQLKVGSQVRILDERGRELEAFVGTAGFVVKGQPFKDKVMLVGPSQTEPERKHITIKVMHNRDHAVIIDRGLEPGQEPVELIVPVKEIGGRKVLFQGSSAECTKWKNAPSDQREAIEATADETFKRKLGVNAVKQFDIGSAGKQAGLGF